MKPFTKYTINLEGGTFYCMDKLNLTVEDILTTMNEWESGMETPTDPTTLNRILENPKLENEIPQLIENQKDFPDRNISITVHYTTSIDTRTPTPTVQANIHWISTSSLTNPIQSIVKRDWLKKYHTVKKDTTQIIKADSIKSLTEINTIVQEKYDKIIHSKDQPEEYKNNIEKRAVKFGQAIEILIEEIENSKEL